LCFVNKPLHDGMFVLFLIPQAFEILLVHFGRGGLFDLWAGGPGRARDSRCAVSHCPQYLKPARLRG